LVTPSAEQLSFVVDKTAVDPALADLFASSVSCVSFTQESHFLRWNDVNVLNLQLGPVRLRAPPKSRYQAESPPPSKDAPEDSTDSTVDDEDLESPSDAGMLTPVLSDDPAERENRKRKRKHQHEEDLENIYMQRLAREEAKDEKLREVERSSKCRKVALDGAGGKQGGSLGAEEEEDEDTSDDDEGTESEGSTSVRDILRHEALAATEEETDLEKSSRTVFLGNVSSVAITSKSDRKTLLAHLSSFLSSLASDSLTTHKVESLRFRSTAFSKAAIPKKAAFVKKELMDATTKSTNAYVVYSTPLAAREAVKRLNGTTVLGRHLRADGVAHPAEIDHKRCVFVGNLGFVDDESLMNAEDGKKKRKKPPADVEEGLWREFGKVGPVESVRVVRDPKTRVGKGFAYVQFTVWPRRARNETRYIPSTTLILIDQDPNAVEAALLYNDKKFPPMLPRKLRVARAKHINKTASANNSTKPRFPTTDPTRATNKISSSKSNLQIQSLYGRAPKLLGRAGAAKLRGSVRSAVMKGDRGISVAKRTPEMVVFEGYRAKSGARPTGMKISGGSGRRKGGKERTRRTARAAAWKSGGGKR
jgi:nucleolar protein 12